ncbi:MAG: 16S rRNA (guanine(966)-N(2))-methyltransferase RsmD [Nocardioidaceae bacterium]
MTRIVSGIAGGRRLRTPPGERTRPTTDRVREALFSALEALLGPLAGLHLLDLFAGSGAVGLEGLSRGAERAVLVEQDRRTASLIVSNAGQLGLAGASVVVQPVQRYLDHGSPEAFDVVFADPPYSLADDLVQAALSALVTRGWLGDQAVVVVERSKRGPQPSWPEGLGPLHDRTYGETVLWYGRRGERLGPLGAPFRFPVRLEEEPPR